MDFDLTEEQQMLQDMARKFAVNEMLPTLKEYESEHKVNVGLIKKMASVGLLGIHIPPAYGGSGYDYTSAALIWEQLSWGSWTQTLVSLGHSVLAGTILMHAASEEQKQKYLPALCRGEIIVATAAVEPNAGSDGSAIETKAELAGDEWIINGTKNFITAGGIADTVLVLAQTDKSLNIRGLALIAVDTATPGFSSAGVHMIGNRAGDTATLGFMDCRVPKENLIGKIGGGFQNTLAGIDTARLFISAGAVGMTQSCLDACVKYAKERVQFGRPIGSFQLIQETIARMAAEIQAIRWSVYYVAELKRKGLPHRKELSSAKMLASEMALRISAEAVRLHGAYGCTDDYPVAHHYQDAMLTTILGGTSEMHILTIGRELLGLNAMP
jgi:butyryl-CoA dehydrogenase